MVSAAIAGAIVDANIGGATTSRRGGGDLRLSGSERIASKSRGLGRRRKRAVRQIMLHTLVTVCVRAGGLSGGFLLIGSVDRLLVSKKEAASLTELPGIGRRLAGRVGGGLRSAERIANGGRRRGGARLEV